MNFQQFVHSMQLPDSYRVIHLVTDGSGNITVNGVAYDDDGALVYKMKPSDQVVLVDCNGSDDLHIELPAVAACEGKEFLIRFIDFGAADLRDEDDSREWSDLAPDADGEYVALRAIGGQWVTIATDIA